MASQQTKNAALSNESLSMGDSRHVWASSGPELPVATAFAPSGLLSLPVEVFGMIQDELLSGTGIITRQIVLENPPHLDGNDFSYRSDIIKPLMHTCRALRAVFSPAYYEHVEACITRTGRVWFMQLAERLTRTCTVLMDPVMANLAAHVRVFTVCLTRRDTKTVIPLFASCLQSLTNLHTLQIMHAHSEMTTALKAGFEGKVISQIRTIILPSCAHNVLRSCTQVRHVTCNEDDGSKLLSAITAKCPHVEVLHGIDINEKNAKRFRKAVPRLREVRMDESAAIAELAGLNDLSVIRLQHVIRTWSKEWLDRNIQAKIKQLEDGKLPGISAAKEHLKKCSGQEKFVEFTLLYRPHCGDGWPPNGSHFNNLLCVHTVKRYNV